MTHLTRSLLQALIVLTVLVGGSLYINIQNQKNETRALAINAARANFYKDTAFRFWGASHGGVYVPATERTPPNPFLKHLPERDIETPSGKKLTLMNPAYMVRQMMEEYPGLYGTQGRITSMKPLHPGNAPDAWEKEALAAFEKGEKEVMAFTTRNGAPHLRLMRPMIAEKSCLKCHRHQGYEEGDIRGGVGVSVPMTPYMALEKAPLRSQIFSHGFFYLLGLLAILAFHHFNKSRLRDRLLHEKIQQNHSRILERLASGQSLHDVLEHLVRGAEEIQQDLLCSLLLLDEEGRRLVNGIAPSLPDFYNDAIDGLEVGEGVGSCGTAAATGKRVVVDDIFSHPYWAPYADLAKRADLAACWSEPVLGSDGKVLGTFAIYARTRRSPSVQELELISDAASLAGIAIERKRTDSLLRSRSAALEAADNAILITDPQGTIRWVNAAFTNTTGFTLEEAKGKKPHILKSGRQDDAFYRQLWDAINAGKVWRGVLVNHRKDGSAYHDETTITPVLDSNGEITEFIAIKQDVTRRMKADQELKKTLALLAQSEGRLQAILNNTSSVVFLKDLQGRYILVNKQFESLFNVSSYALKGKTDFDIFPQEAAEAFRANDLKTLETGLNEIEEEVPHEDGTHTYQVVKFPLMEEQGKPYAVCGMAIDITERIQMEKALRLAKQEAENANRTKSRFLATMSHEIRTPMNGILGMAELLLETRISGKKRHYIETIRKSGENLLTIINDILDFSKIEAGRLEIEQADFDLIGLLREMADFFSEAARKKGIDFKLVADPELPRQLRGDPTRLRQILVNLASNAVKFTADGAVTLTATPLWRIGETVRLRFTLQDTGIGIPVEKIGSLFEPFTQADDSTTRKFGGTGLGLAITRRLTDLMGGKISAESQSGEGSLFSVVLPFQLAVDQADPIASTEAVAEEMAEGTPVELPPDRRLLLVEDDPINRMVLIGMLKKMGIAPDVAEDGREALERMDDTVYDIILMDVQMPEMDGFAAAREIRQREESRGSRRTPIVALTAYAMKGDREKCLEAGMDDYLPKPVQGPDLRAAVVRWLDRRKGKMT